MSNCQLPAFEPRLASCIALNHLHRLLHPQSDINHFMTVNRYLPTKRLFAIQIRPALPCIPCRGYKAPTRTPECKEKPYVSHPPSKSIFEKSIVSYVYWLFIRFLQFFVPLLQHKECFLLLSLIRNHTFAVEVILYTRHLTTGRTEIFQNPGRRTCQSGNTL